MVESGGGGVAFCVNQMCFFHSYSAEFWYCVTMALCHCYFLCVFPEIKSSFLDILDIYLFFFFFSTNGSSDFRISQPIETVIHGKAWVTVQIIPEKPLHSNPAQFGAMPRHPV